MAGRGDVLGGRYTLAERLGGGGMGAVWRAEDQVLERQVAVKILHPALFEDGTFAQRFRREAQLLAVLDHPGIVAVHDYGETEGDDRLAYIVMELIDGRPLNDVLAEDGPLPAGRALGLLAKALDALQTAHRRDIVHRDLKPSNLMLRADGQVAVADFGIARAMASTKITASHTVLGTALYMAPEQAEGSGTTPASDLYSIGVVCYELLTGEPPFDGETVLEVALKHIRDPAPALPDSFPAAVREFVATALAKKPEDRFPDAAAMAAAARAAVGEEAAVAPVEEPVPAKPAAAEKPAAPEKPSAPEADTAPAARRPRRRFLVPVVIPVIITVSAGTAVLVERAPFGSEAKPSAPPAAAAQAPTTTAPTAATAPAVTAPATAPATTPAPAATTPATPPAASTAANPAPPAPPAAGGTAPTAGKPPAQTAPPAQTPAPGNPPAATAAPPAPAPATSAAPPPAVPQGCGGTNWGYITNVGDGLRLGLANDNLAGGNAAVMGGATAYGWVHSVPSSWHQFNPCNMDAPALVQEQGGNGVGLSPGFSVLYNWSVVAASTPGAYYLKDYMSQSCLTDNGASKRVTMGACTPGNKAQEWRIP